MNLYRESGRGHCLLWPGHDFIIRRITHQITQPCIQKTVINGTLFSATRSSLCFTVSLIGGLSCLLIGGDVWWSRLKLGFLNIYWMNLLLLKVCNTEMISLSHRGNFKCNSLYANARNKVETICVLITKQEIQHTVCSAPGIAALQTGSFLLHVVSEPSFFGGQWCKKAKHHPAICRDSWETSISLEKHFLKLWDSSEL